MSTMEIAVNDESCNAGHGIRLSCFDLFRRLKDDEVESFESVKAEDKVKKLSKAE